MFFIVYVSTSVRLMSREALLAMLDGSRRRNVSEGITGLLLYHDGNFMQVIEGPEETVRRLFDKIQADRRHKDIIVLLEGPLERRQFSEWSMGFKNLDEPLKEGTPGYSRFLETPLTGDGFKETPHAAIQFLLSFKKYLSD